MKNLTTCPVADIMTNSTAPYSLILNIGLVAAWRTACARLALFIHGIMSAKRTCEVQPAILVRESSTQLNCIRWIHASDTLHIIIIIIIT